MVVAERAEPELTRASAMLQASRAAYALRRAGEARELLASSRALAADDEILSLEQETHAAAIALWLEQRTAQGRAMARAAASRARRLAKRRTVDAPADTRVQRAYLDALRLDYEAAMQEGNPAVLLRAAEARQRAARGLELEEFLMAALALGVALRLNGRVRQAVTRFRRLWAEADRAVLPHLGVDAGYWLARSLALLGELVEADEIVRDVTALAHRVGDVPRARHTLSRLACGVHLERGDVSQALPALERAAAEEPSEHLRIVLHGDCAIWIARLDGPAAAERVQEQLAAANACVEASGCPRCGGDLLLLAAEALARVGELSAGRLALEQWEGLKRRGDDLDALMQLHADALLRPNPDERADALHTALVRAAASPYALAALWMQLDLGLALAQAGSQRAAAELVLAATSARDRGANTVQRLAERALRSLGIRTWRRGTAGLPLTGREEEVARLVAAGSTNQEVAATLFLSPKTVERHLVNVFRKLEIRNRTELSARIAEVAGQIAGFPR